MLAELTGQGEDSTEAIAGIGLIIGGASAFGVAELIVAWQKKKLRREHDERISQARDPRTSDDQQAP